MDKESIIKIIQWGPVVLFAITLFIGFLVGIIKGRRKAIKGLIYQTIFIVTMFLLTPTITRAALGIQVNGVSAESYFNDFIQNNETLKSMYEQIPALEEVVKTYPGAIASLVVFLVLVFVGLPLSFPIYIVYSIIYNLIYKKIFHYSKYELDENGKPLRTAKGKKIKAKHPKHRLAGGAIKGAEAVLVSSIILMPVGVITRLYEDARKTSSKDLKDIEYLKNYGEYFDYINAFNDSFIGKATNSVVNKGLAGYLTQIKINGEKTTLENDASSIIVAAVHIENSGIIDLVKDGVDIKTLDLSKLDIDKLDKAIEALFKSATIKALLVDGTKYILNNNLKETLVKYTDDEDIVSKLGYSNGNEIKEDLLRVTAIVRDIINANLLTIYQNSGDNYVKMVNEVKTADVESILNKVISVKILSEAMPSVATKLLKDRGLTEELSKDNNSQFVTLLLDVVKLVKTLEIESLSDVTEGNVMDNLVNRLYVAGAIKSNTVDHLATLLSDVSSYKVFESVLVKYLNDFLEKYEITLNAKMITRVQTKQEWKDELAVLDNIFKLYKDYKDTETIDFLTANELIAKLKGTKAMILAVPIAYQKVFPTLGIETDLSKIEYVDYTQPNADTEEARFYNYWREQLIHFEAISDELAKLRIESLEDVSLDLLENPNNVSSLAKVVSEVFDTDLIKDGVSDLLNDKLKDLLVDYDVNLGDSVIDNVRNVINDYPYYVEIDDVKYNVRENGGNYYLALAANVNKNDDVSVPYNNGKITYNAHEYTVHDNSSYIVWENELTNLSNISKVLKSGEFTTSENISSIMNSLDRMYLLKEAKVDLLIYAVKQINIMPEEEVNAIDKTTLNFTKEKDIIINAVSEYDTLQDVTGSSFDFKTMDEDTINSLSSILQGEPAKSNGVLKSAVFGNYVADKIVSFAPAEYGVTRNKVKASNTWANDLTLMRDAMNMDADSFDSETLNALFTKLEISDLVGDQKEDLLLKTARQIEVAGVAAIDDGLTADDINYYDEKQALLTFADNKSLVEHVSDMTLETMDTTSLATVLADGIKSKMFGPSIVNNLVTVITDNDIRHDLDAGTSTTNLKTTIEGINSGTGTNARATNIANWKDELDGIKSLASISDAAGATGVFTTIENSDILRPCKAHIMIKVVTTINTGDLSDLVVPTVTQLSASNYAQYDKEVALMNQVIGEGNSDKFNNLSFDGMSAQQRENLGNMMNAMEQSLIFRNKYVTAVTGITDPITSNTTITTWGLEIIDDPEDASINWVNELGHLSSINDNKNILTDTTATEFAGMTTDQKRAKVAIIGATLDEIDASDLIKSGSSQSVANNVVDKISDHHVSNVSKNPGETWTEAFERVLSLS